MCLGELWFECNGPFVMYYRGGELTQAFEGVAKVVVSFREIRFKGEGALVSWYRGSKLALSHTDIAQAVVIGGNVIPEPDRLIDQISGFGTTTALVGDDSQQMKAGGMLIVEHENSPINPLGFTQLPVPVMTNSLIKESSDFPHDGDPYRQRSGPIHD